MTVKAGSTVYVCMHVCVGVYVYGVSVREEGKGVRERVGRMGQGRKVFRVKLLRGSENSFFKIEKKKR